VRLYLNKNPSQKSAGGVAQGEVPKFKPQYCKKIRERETDLGDLLNMKKE
jgi:hypothetical protein